MVKPEIGGNVNFEIKSQFMRELREDTLSGNKNDDAREHVERILDIKWHGGSNSRKVSNGGSDGISAVNKLDSLGCDMKNLNNRPPFDENRPNIVELMNKHIKESTRRRADMEDWIKKLQESTDMDIRNQNASPHLVKGVGYNFTSLYVSKKIDEGPLGVLPCQLPPKELSPGSFTLPFTIETSMLVEVTDMSKKAPMGTVENILVKIDMFVFPTGFVIIDMLGDPNETMILGRPFLATIHAPNKCFSWGDFSGNRGRYDYV
ncbi:DNA-binding pseudobarrel domain-containing protein [Tanacetum coccineum]